MSAAGRAGRGALGALAVALVASCGGTAETSSSTDAPGVRSASTVPVTTGEASSTSVPATVPQPMPPDDANGPSVITAAAEPSTTAVPTTTQAPIQLPPIVTFPADIGQLAPRDVSVPVAVRIDGYVDGPVSPTSVDEFGELAVPPEAGVLAWYRHGPSPGQRGSAVIAGHLDWRGELGVFVALAAVPVGATVMVTYDDGSERPFTVTEIELVGKPEVALSDVFTRRGPPRLRLVTCGGEFDDSTNHYRSNVIVTAVPA